MNGMRQRWTSLSSRHKTMIILAVIALLTLIVTIHFVQSTHPAAANVNKLVEVETITPQPLQQTIRLLGTIHPKHATILMAKGNGMLDTLVPTGQKISKGTLIAKIDNPDIEKNAQLSHSAVQLARAQFERLNKLLKTGYVSAKEAEEKKQFWIDAQKELAKTRIDRNNLRFYAPFDGVIGAYKKREGTQVNQGDAVVSIYDPASLVVDFDIPCSNLNGVHQGQRVHVLGRQYALSHIQNMIDEDTHMCPADVDIVCKDCLIGATVDVELVVAEKPDALTIPFQAVFLKNSNPFVYVVEQDKVVLVAVKTGLMQQNRVEIIDGLKPGQQVIIKGQERLYPNMTVDVYKPASQSLAG
ncbi:efflux RND transporter periplasmic adaptor subunit [Legionella spiritensis]|uniref:efflux RND transporter periplasmic adaptor subunit n=1 Tax=Legionella spiritensis TaxID=452 RepID=UPI000F6FF740|nr:efflux RND transporter periplasmic adaptor subunit [Legionella spiritensis]VEG91998.1 efflux protein [Legionella spiritensis]